MARLLVHVEGETEETFVNEALAGHLYDCGYEQVSARLMGNARQHDRRGGIRSWKSVRGDILKHLKGDTGCLATMMVDYYGLPMKGRRAWPGRAAAGKLPFARKAATVQAALHADVRQKMGRNFDPGRFVPYVIMHEFEGLLFSDCKRFAEAIGRPDLASPFQAIRDAFASPEEINDTPVGHPSKRVQALVPDYEKPLFGTLAVLEIGLDLLRAECPHFQKWLEGLEAWIRKK